MADSVAKVYADALFEIAVEENKCQEYRTCMRELKDTMDERFIQLLCHPRISREEKKTCIENVYGKALDPVLLNFLRVLVDKNRFQYVMSICDEFDLNYVEHFNIIQASVCSARKLSPEEKEKLKLKLEQKYQQSVECTYQIDPSLLAGIKVQVKDQIMDNTALNRLNKMKDSIAG